MKEQTLKRQIGKLQKQLDNLVMDDEERAEKLHTKIEKLRKELFFLQQRKQNG